MAKIDPFLSLDCARVEGVGAQSKERKGSNFAAQRSGAMVLQARRAKHIQSKNLAIAIWQPWSPEASAPEASVPEASAPEASKSGARSLAIAASEPGHPMMAAIAMRPMAKAGIRMVTFFMLSQYLMS